MSFAPPPPPPPISKKKTQGLAADPSELSASAKRRRLPAMFLAPYAQLMARIRRRHVHGRKL